MSKLSKFKKSFLNKFVYDYNFKLDSSYNGRKNLQIIINATKIFCNNKNIYLEIGVFRGHTLINNAINNKKIKCVGVDNFSLYNEDKKNLRIIKNKIKENHLHNVEIINKDFEKATSFIKYKIGVLFIDGPHDYRSQLIALLKYKKFLAKECIIIIDDSNYYHVRKANQDFLDTNEDFFLLKEIYTNAHIANVKEDKKKKLINGNWNGLNILYRGNVNIKKKITLPKNEKKLIELFYISHDTFRHKYAFNVSDILNYVYDFLDGKRNKMLFIKKIKSLKIPSELKKYLKFRSQNIFK